MSVKSGLPYREVGLFIAFMITKAREVAAKQPLMVAVKRDLDSGVPLQIVKKKLVGSGASEQDATRFVESATNGHQVTCPKCGFEYLGIVEVCANCGSKLTPSDRSRTKTIPVDSMQSQLPPTPEITDLIVELKSESAKHRCSAIQELAKRQVDSEAAVAALAKLAYGDPDQYVRDEAKSALQTPIYQAILRGGNPFVK